VIIFIHFSAKNIDFDQVKKGFPYVFIWDVDSYLHMLTSLAIFFDRKFNELSQCITDNKIDVFIIDLFEVVCIDFIINKKYKTILV